MSLYTINNEILNKLKIDENYSKNICENIEQIGASKAKEMYKKFINFCEENNLIKAGSWFYYYLGKLNYELLNLDKSIKCHETALKGFESINDNEGIVFAINGIFIGYVKQQKFEKAIEFGIKGIKLASEENNYVALARLKTNMLGVYEEIGEYEKAIELYDDIEKIGYIANEENQIVNNLNRCLCEFKLGNKDNSIKYGEKAYKIAKENKSDYLIPNILSELANIYIDKGEFDTAIEKLNEAKGYIRDEKDNIAYLSILMKLGDLELKRKNYKLAIEKFENACKTILNDYYKNELREIYNKLSLAYKGIEDYKKSLEYLEKYIDIDKKIQKELKSEKIKELNKAKEEENKTYKSLYIQTENMYKFGQKIISNLEKENILNIIVEEISNLIDYDIVQIGLYKEDKNVFEFLLCLEEGNRVEIPPMSINEESFNGYCIKQNKEILINDIQNEYYKYINVEKNDDRENKFYTNNKICNSAIFIPLTINNKPIGSVAVQSYEKGKYNLKDLNTIKIISSFIAIALENSRLYKEVRYFARHDYLTRILNKGEALKEGKEIYDIMIKNKEPLAIMMIDIDDFKNINDTYGHQFGDRVIQNVADVISKSIRKNDIIGRYGGEEFIVFFNGNSKKDYLAISERIRCNIENSPIENNLGEFIKVTCSIGVVYKDVIKESLEDLINFADMALYKAKKTGKNKVVIIKE